MDARLLDKLRKVLALTTSPVEGEAQAAAAMLAKMLELHNLDIADLERKGADRPAVREERHDLGKAAFKWKLTLADQIAEHYYCHALIDHANKHVAFVGRPDNVESLRMLYAWLIEQVKRVASEERRHHYVRTDEHIDPLRWQVGFGEGAAIRLGERLREQRRREQTEAGTALVVSHKSEVSDYLEKVHGYRIDGRMTARAQEREREWLEYAAKREAEERRLAELKANDIEAYHRECPWEKPEAVAHRRKQDEAWAKRQERNARRRKGGPAWRPETAEARRRRIQSETAHGVGFDAANRINLQPFLADGEIKAEIATDRKRIGG